MWNVMESEVISVPETTTAREAAHLLLARHVHGAPVVDAQGHVRGVLSLVDLLRVLCEGSHAGVPVRDLVDRAPVTIEAGAGLYEAAKAMVQSDVHRLVVVDEDDKPVGIVAPMDILRAIVNLEGGFHVRPER